MDLSKKTLYRYPWSTNDNPIGWLEVTDVCDLLCKGCYREKMTGQRPLEELKKEIELFRDFRRCDSISIAGGEPLTHPEILEIVAHVSRCGMKPVILTNANKLTPSLLQELKRAGLKGFTVHVDCQQGRREFPGATESELNAFRQHVADMIHDAGDLYVSFGATIYHENLAQIPQIVDWAHRNVDRVNGMVFIAFRGVPMLDNVTYVRGDSAIEVDTLQYRSERTEEIDITSREIWETLRRLDPNFTSGAYLGGTTLFDSFKWVITCQICSKDRVLGYVGPRTMEIQQALYHLMNGRYLAYDLNGQMSPWALLGASFFDPHFRRAFAQYGSTLLTNPLKLMEPLYLQSIVIVQPPDLLPDGGADMCDACPDMTFYQGRLVNSCRMDEIRKYGGFLSANMEGFRKQ